MKKSPDFSPTSVGIFDLDIDARTAEKGAQQESIPDVLTRQAAQVTIVRDEIVSVADRTESSRSAVDYEIALTEQLGRLKFNGDGYTCQQVIF